ncbi:MAG: HDIG domain-containing protein [Muribaculaceae bacterium]|nr:HDIG domain-containing protein [Muribaculaceae bacterium]
MSPIELINSIYPAESPLRGILISHSEAVAREALDIARRKNLPLDPVEIENAAMLHDIGIIRTDAPGIHCHGNLNYMCHGVAGADMIRKAGLPEIYARVAERHTGAGLTHEEIAEAGLPLPPDRSYMPETLLEKLICYADCFYSKTGSNNRKSLERVRASMAKFGPGVLERFEALHKMFS